MPILAAIVCLGLAQTADKHVRWKSDGQPAYLLAPTVDIVARNSPAEAVISDVARQTKLPFLRRGGSIEGKITRTYLNMPADFALNQVLSPLGAQCLFGGNPTSITVEKRAKAVSDKLVSLEIKKGDVREAIRAWGKQADVSYSLSTTVQGEITVHAEGQAEETLTRILDEVGATFIVEGGVYAIISVPFDISGLGDKEIPIASGNFETRLKALSAIARQGGVPVLVDNGVDLTGQIALSGNRATLNSAIRSIIGPKNEAEFANYWVRIRRAKN